MNDSAQTEQSRSLSQLTDALVAQCQEHYGNDIAWADVRVQLADLLRNTLPKESQVVVPEGAQDKRDMELKSPSENETPYRVHAGNWFYNVSNNWLILVVIAIPAAIATAATGPIGLTAALAALPVLVNNLHKIDRNSLEWRVYQTIADETGRQKRGPTLDEIKEELGDVSSDQVVMAVSNLKFGSHVVDEHNGHYVPHAF